MITDRLMTYAAGAVAVLCLALSVSQCAGKLKAEREVVAVTKVANAAKASLKTCQTNTDTLRGSLDSQSAEVDRLKREGEARVAESRKAVSAARSVAEKARRDAQRILEAKPGSSDRCEAASMLVDEVVG